MRILGKAPDFNLPGVNGETVSLESLRSSRKAVVVIFTCNHCPYSLAYEDRLVKLQAQYAGQGIALVAINPDNETMHPEDTFEGMKAYAAEKKFNFPYLRDQAGDTAQAYGAQVMPEVFLVDAEGMVRYAGRIDDCWQSSRRVKRQDLREAVEDLLHNREIAVKATPPIGCAIKRR